MLIEARVLVRVRSNDLVRHKGDYKAAIMDNLEDAELDESSIDGDQLVFTLEDSREYADADTPGTPIYRFFHAEEASR
jgi:hypothetical protein